MIRSFKKISLWALCVFAIPLLLALPSQAAEYAWKKVENGKGVEYVSLKQVQKFYKFPTLTQSGSRIEMKNKDITLKFTTGAQEVLMNNVKFIFSNPISAINGSYHISVTDLLKIVDPILRPASIASANAFDTVIIDPGHGGGDPGGSSRYGTEASYNLRVARMLKDHLTKLKFKVVMTRNSNTFLTLQQRVAIANKYQNAVFVSIHFNTVGSRGASRARGIETFTLSPVGVAHYGRALKSSDFQSKAGNRQDSANIALATAVHWGTRMKLKKAGIDVPDRGIRRARFSVLTGVKHPAILLEGGFLSHPTESRLIHSPAYQKALASSICDSIVFYRSATLERKRK
ncbi:N-acetylmuramoyl-L-alanine amidase [Akkermansiaceae bacterium]|nr:N-acetylmuramoyl-L-alanine amidase [bacterium]MDB4546265.1 N-acetylmuramoyl-L-alanine amidase [Akkermansiaceae bacterium]MDB4578651.1 N-acetylmuramoyl-L-alanine amidase [Akkermansiaceae bacterium]